jgi:xanthine/uracil permease
MNFLKIGKAFAGCVMGAGFFLMIASVGTSDYMDAIHEYYPVIKMLPTAVIGIVLMILGLLMFKKLNDDWFDESDWEDSEDWDDEIYND